MTKHHLTHIIAENWSRMNPLFQELKTIAKGFNWEACDNMFSVTAIMHKNCPSRSNQGPSCLVVCFQRHPAKFPCTHKIVHTLS